MIQLSRTEAQRLRPWFAEERPGPDAIAAHVLSTGHGHWRVDRWPEPRAVLVESAGNYLLRGDPRVRTVEALRPHVYGSVAAPPAFESLLRALDKRFTVWPRVVFELNGSPVVAEPADRPGATVRPLHRGDADAVDGLD